MPVAYLPQSKRLLDKVREVLRYRHYSFKTERAYLYWVRFYVRWHGCHGQMKHPRDMGMNDGCWRQVPPRDRPGLYIYSRKAMFD